MFTVMSNLTARKLEKKAYERIKNITVYFELTVLGQVFKHEYTQSFIVFAMCVSLAPDLLVYTGRNGSIPDR